jgi:hypothetical protein
LYLVARFIATLRAAAAFVWFSAENPAILKANKLRSDMIDRGLIAGDIMTPAGIPPVDGSPSAPTEPLEVRVTRLEGAVAQLQDTHELEERVTERVATRLRESADRTAQGITAEAIRHTVHPEPEPATPGNDLFVRLRRSWFVYEAYVEARTIIRMFFDRRYRVSWKCKVIPVVLLFFFLTSWFWIPFTSVLPGFIISPINKAIDLVIAFLLWKFLTREASRYRAFLGES